MDIDEAIPLIRVCKGMQVIINLVAVVPYVFPFLASRLPCRRHPPPPKKKSKHNHNQIVAYSNMVDYCAAKSLK